MQQARRRGAWLNLEGLEERTLLSVSSGVSAVADLSQTAVSTSAVGSTTAGSASIPSTTIVTTVGQETQEQALAASVADRNTLATVTVGPSDTAASDPASTNAVNPHIVTGQPTASEGTPPKPGQATTSNPDKYNPSQPSQAALAALAKSSYAQPQYLILPNALQGATPDQGLGPGGGYTPQQIAGAYGVNAIQYGQIIGNGAGQTIAIIDAYDNPSFVSSTNPNFDSSALHIFDQYFNLPDPPSFQIYDEYGNPGGTGEPNPGWGGEIALDIEWAHAMAPAANIDLVEGYTSSFDDLGTAAKTAATQLGADVVSMSFGAYLEDDGDASLEDYVNQTYFIPALAANPNVTFIAASADGGAGVSYPSVSPYVVSAGGTSLDATGNTYTAEYPWSDGGGGISTNPSYTAAPYQQAVTGYSQRTTPDFSSDSNPYTGVSVYDPYVYGGWVVFGGTSVASPTLAGELSIADQIRTTLGGQPLDGPNQTLPGLYSDIDYTNSYRDITQTGSGPEEGDNGYPVGPGYDLDTGIGSPQANGLIPYLALYDLGPAVVSSSPAAGQVIAGNTPPTTFTLTFNEPIDPSSVVAGEFTVNGIPADSDTLSPDDTSITYTFNTSPVINQGIETMNLPADSVVGLNDGLPNIGAFNASFYYVDDPAPGHGHQPAGGIGPDHPGDRPGRPVQRGRQSLQHQDERLPAQPGNGDRRRAADADLDRPDPLGRDPGRHAHPDHPGRGVLGPVRGPQPRIHGHLHHGHRVGALSDPAPGRAPGGQPDLRPVGHRLHRLRRRHRHLHAGPGRRPDPVDGHVDRPQPDRHGHTGGSRRQRDRQRDGGRPPATTPCSRRRRSRPRGPTRWSSAAPAGRPATTRCRRS